MNDLVHTKGQVVIKIDLDGKDRHVFMDGTEIKVIRRVQNLNRRHTEPVNAFVVSADNIPAGAEILIHHNPLHDTYRIFNYKPLSGKDEADTVKYFSIPESECFFWREDEKQEWKPLKNFASGLRVFRPYTGKIEGIAPTLIKECLYVTSGELKGKVVFTLRACDYEIIFLDKGRENNLIRFRHSEDDENFEREEVVAIADNLTEDVNCGKLYVGYTADDAKPIV